MMKRLNYNADNLEFLLKYANLGLRLHPLRDWDAGAKECKFPRLEGWKEKATTDPALIMVWLRQFPKANWGIATGEGSGVVMLDVDNRADESGKTGFDHLAELENAYGELPKTWTAITGTNGRHYYFKHPGVHIPSKTDCPAPKLDIRGDGGQAVVPPSINANGQPYRWAEGCAPWETELAEMPEWLLALLKRANRPIIGKKPKRTATDPSILPEELGEGDVTWEQIYSYPMNQAKEPKMSGGWLRAFCPIHGGDNQRSFSVCMEPGEYSGKWFDEGFFTCHACGAHGFIVGTEGWHKRKKGANERPSVLDKYVPKPIISRQEETSEDEIKGTEADPLSILMNAQEETESWETLMSYVEQVKLEHAHLRTFAKKFPELLEPLEKAEKRLNLAITLQDSDLVENKLEELVAVYKSVKIVYDEEKNREWGAFLESLRTYISYLSHKPTKNDIAMLCAKKVDRSRKDITPFPSEVLPEELRVPVKSYEAGQIKTLDLLADVLSKKLKPHLGKNYEGLCIVRDPDDLFYYHVVPFEEKHKYTTPSEGLRARRTYAEVLSSEADIF